MGNRSLSDELAELGLRNLRQPVRRRAFTRQEVGQHDEPDPNGDDKQDVTLVHDGGIPIALQPASYDDGLPPADAGQTEGVGSAWGESR